MNINPITRLDYPDPDVIRVGEFYYMVSTTMYFFPGGEILRSRDLVHWEHLSYIYDSLDDTPGQRLEGTENIYGQGMWAACIRFHQGLFYVCFVANDTGKAYLYTASDPAGPWQRRPIQGFYHDCSLLFDQDGRVYISYGNRDIRITELKEDLSGPKLGGLDRVVVSDRGNPNLGYEGSHLYCINEKYYLFLIHSRRDRWRRTQACFTADSLEGEFTGGDVLDDDMGYWDQGVAQGGIVDTPEGHWYAVLFQDRGAVRRIPVLVPMRWENGFLVLGENGRIPESFPVPETVPAAPLVSSDDFTTSGDAQTHGTFGLKSCWQFNHQPELSLTKLDRERGTWSVTTGKLCSDVTQAKNTLTHRMLFPRCAGEVTVSAASLREGDVAGLCVLQSCYGLIGITRYSDGFRLTVRTRDQDETSQPVQLSPEREWESIPWESSQVQLRVEVDFNQRKDQAAFFYRASGSENWTQLGPVHKLYFRLDHFTGCRFALFNYATKEAGGTATFSHFVYDPQVCAKKFPLMESKGEIHMDNFTFYAPTYFSFGMRTRQS